PGEFHLEGGCRHLDRGFLPALRKWRVVWLRRISGWFPIDTLQFHESPAGPAGGCEIRGPLIESPADLECIPCQFVDAEYLVVRPLGLRRNQLKPFRGLCGIHFRCAI